MPTLNFELHDAQSEVFNYNSRFKVVAAGRRFGKTFLSAVAILIEGLKTVNDKGYDLTLKEVWYVAPTFDQAKGIMWKLLKKLGEDVIVSAHENTATLTLVNGRTIHLKGADRPDTLRGRGLSYVVCDEYASMKLMVWEEILAPALTDVEGGALFIGTPVGKNHFYGLFQQGLNPAFEDWMSWQFQSRQNPYLNAKEVEKARSRMTTSSYRQEHEASFEATGAGVFQEDMLIKDDKEPADGDYVITVDPAGFEDTDSILKNKINSLDRCAITVAKVGTYGWWIKTIDAGRWGVRETATRILRHAQQVQARVVGIEKGSLKNALMPYMTDQMNRLGIHPVIEPLTHGGTKKTERIAWALEGRFQHGRIKFNSGPYLKDFMSEMLDFPSKMSHDDMLDSLAYVAQLAEVNYLDSEPTDYYDIEEDYGDY